MNIADRLAAATRGQATSVELQMLARDALAIGEEAGALPILRRAAAAARDARLWQWTGLLERALDDLGAALDSFAKAAALAPNDASIAQGRAQTALDAGIDAVTLFERARMLTPANGDVLIGLVAAQLAAGQGAKAEAALDAAVTGSPLWIDGHLKLAQLRSLLGQPERATASFDRALAAQPHDPPLWQGLFDLHLTAENYGALQDAVARARAVLPNDIWQPYAAVAAAELGQVAQADALFGAMGDAAEGPMTVWRLRHLLRQGRLAPALALIDRALQAADAAAIWPYAAAAWRLSGDARLDWLLPPGLVSVIDLTPDLPPLADLAAVLRGLHHARGEYLDQSVRGGTQTDGPLLSRVDPLLQAARGPIIAAVDGYIAALPPRDAAHPTLGLRRDRDRRFAGSWSVRLRGGGHHANHVHPQGWISSALYIALPPADAADPQAGWLTIGQPQASLGLDLPPLQFIEPRPGQLVLFPSWLWHGTRRFPEGERLTIAFDIAPPR